MSQNDVISKYSYEPVEVVNVHGNEIHVFDKLDENRSDEVIEDFGNEWLKFKDFDLKEIDFIGSQYFDIVTDDMLKDAYAIDFGCGTGRWSKCIASKVKFIEAIDPSNAVYSAAQLLSDNDNVRVSKVGIESVPFEDETFDFGMSIGVLHHIPDTQKAMIDCVKKIKKGGHFYVYLYYNLENRGILFRSIFGVANMFREVTSRLPKFLKQIVCDLIAILVYFPLSRMALLLTKMGMEKLADRIPLAPYKDKSFMILRNDALDRFGTRLEQRFGKEEITTMMKNSGLSEITFGESMPFYHAVGKKI